MLIKLKDSIDWELLALGCKPGDEVEATIDPLSTTGGLHFEKRCYGTTYNCSIWPQDYEIVDKKFILVPVKL